MAIADAVRKHQHSLLVGIPDHVEGSAAYALYLDHLTQRFGHIITIFPADAEAAEQGKAEHRRFAEHREHQARFNARVAAMPVPAGLSGTSLYQALDRFAARATEQTSKESGRVEAANAMRLKDSTRDMDLAEFGYSAMERVRNYWTSRPIAKLRGGKSTGRPISLTTVDNHLSTARRFVRWLDRSDAFKWEMPRHGPDALTANVRQLASDDEVAGRRHGVRVFAIDQLAKIYGAATDFERLLILLGLNAGMAQSEISTLRWDEIENEPQTIKRVRRKSGVYGEFLLWEQTRAALAWWQKIRPANGPLVMITATGKSYMRTEIANAWSKVRVRLEQTTETKVDWWLPFKHLRKTGAQLVREVSDGEIAGTFLSHGQPVASDPLAGQYSNRQFHKVAEALKTIEDRLQPVFNTAQASFSSTTLGGTRVRRKRVPQK